MTSCHNTVLPHCCHVPYIVRPHTLSPPQSLAIIIMRSHTIIAEAEVIVPAGCWRLFLLLPLLLLQSALFCLLEQCSMYVAHCNYNNFDCMPHSVDCTYMHICGSSNWLSLCWRQKDLCKALFLVF